MAFVLTSISGNLISAASAGFAPTNSADVSAIASAYASSKADSSALSSYALSSDVSGVIDTVSSNSASWGGGATGDYVEKSSMEASIGSGNDVSATAFAFGENNSAASRSFALGSYCNASASSIAIGSGSRASSNSLSVGYSGFSNNLSLSLGNRVSANMYSLAAGNYSKAGDNSLAVGNNAVAALDSISVGMYCYTMRGYARGNNNSGDFAFMDGTSLRAKSAIAFGTCNLSGNNDSAVFVIGDGTNSATGRHDLMTISRDGEITLYSSTADTVGTGIMSSIRAISAAATGGGVDSATVSAIASGYAESAVSSKLDESATAEFYSTSNPSSFVDSAYVDSAVSGKLDSSASSSYYTTDNVSGFVDSSYVDSAVSGKLDSSASSSFYTTANESGFLTGLPKNISVANLSASGHVRATATGQDLYGNFDYAGMYFRSGSQRPYNIGIDNTGSNFYIATAKNGFERIYASSIQSWNGKADSSALSSYVPYSSLEYNTASAISGINGSALAAGSTYSAGEGIDITDDVISVEAPVDIVAGPGIVIDNPDGNTLRVSAEADAETVLWEGTAASVHTAKSGLTLTESPFNFEYVEVHWVPWAYNDAGSYKQEAVVRVHLTSSFPRIGLINEWTDESNDAMFLFSVNGYFTSTKFYTTHVKWFNIGNWTVNTTGTGQYITKIVGVHRIANN